MLLIGGFGACLGIFFVAVAAGQRGGDRFFDNPWLAVPGLVAWFCGAAAGVAALWAIVRRAERAPVVFLVGVVGLLVLAFGVVEFAFPH